MVSKSVKKGKQKANITVIEPHEQSRTDRRKRRINKNNRVVCTKWSGILVRGVKFYTKKISQVCSIYYVVDFTLPLGIKRLQKG